jgi:nucleoside-diphosphate-sugar epimerase
MISPNPDVGRPVLIIGATGFAGGALAQNLAADGVRLRAMVRPNSDTSTLKKLGAELVEGDICDPKAVDAAVSGCALVYNFASPFRSATPTEAYFREVNRDGPVNVANAVQKHGVPRFVHCSTIGVHGHVQEIPCTETSPYNPGDSYQTTKLEGELALQEMIKGGLPAVIMRPASMYGPGDLRMLKMFRLIHTGRWRMVGDGTAWFHATYIDDLVRGFRLCGEHRDAPGEVFILAGEEPLRLNDLANAVADAVGAPHPTKRVPLQPVLVAARICETLCRPFGIEPPLHERRVRFFTNDRYFDAEKARRVLGFRTETGLSEGLKRTADWYFEKGLLGGTTAA